MVNITKSIKGRTNEDISRSQWQTLEVYNGYRLLVSIFLLVLHFLDLGVVRLGYHSPGLYVFIVMLYVIFSIVILLYTRKQKLPFIATAYVSTLIDISVLLLLMHISSGAVYGFGVLLCVVIAAASIITATLIGLFLALYASIIVAIAFVFSRQFTWFGKASSTEDLILVFSFFVTGVVGFAIAHRIYESEALARKRRTDLAKLEELNRLIIERMKSGVMVIDSNDRIRTINEACWYLLGVPKRSGNIFIGDISPQLTAQLRAWKKMHAHNAEPLQIDLANQGILAQFVSLQMQADKDKNLTLLILEDSAKMGQKAQQMKLASLGRLTASIAHEIRNPLGAISHAAQLLDENQQLGVEGKRLVSIIHEQSARMNEVIENVLQLSRRKQAAPSMFSLGPWLEEFAKNFESPGLESPKIHVKINPKDLKIFFDKSQLQQILNNVCENGLRHNFKTTKKEEITIHAGLTPGKREPFLEVIDQGEGVAADLVDYIFEPFFTTKDGGTGLGLYIARELCEANHARITHFPNEKGGSCFRINFFKMGGH